MSRLWDTPGFWARTEADEMLRDYPMTDVTALADSIERSPNIREGDVNFTREVVAELRRRAAADVRFWPEYVGFGDVAQEVCAAIADMAKNAWDADETEEVPVQWWQRW
ncbi:MAG: hypothetical protein JWR77_1287 [Rhizorhabdus sp.]|nr:hypothetical protein [Rhizorhabdus sp.]